MKPNNIILSLSNIHAPCILLSVLQPTAIQATLHPRGVNNNLPRWAGCLQSAFPNSNCSRASKIAVWGFLQLQARFCNCGLQTHQIFRCICNGRAAALQFLASANLQALQLQGRKASKKVKKTGKVLQSGPPRSIIPLSPPRGKLAVGQLVHGAFVYVVSVVFRLNGRPIAVRLYVCVSYRG